MKLTAWTLRYFIAAFLTAFLLAYLLAGCALGPDYKRPEIAVPDSYRGQVSPEEAASIADLEWWEFFKDDDLNALVQRALDNNLDLQIAASRIDEARASAKKANADLLPRVAGVADTSPTTTPGADTGLYTVGAALDWEIDFFGRLRRSKEAAEAELLASEEGRRAVYASLVADVAASWFEMRELDEELDITRQTVAAQKESLQLVQLLNSKGMVSGAEEWQAKNQLATTSVQVPVTERHIKVKENALSYLLGIPPKAVRRPAEPAVGFAGPEVPAGLPSQLLERRPDIRQAERQLQAATARIGAAKAAAVPFPRISLTTFLGGMNTELVDVLREGITALGPALDWPLLDFGRSQAGVDAAVAQARETELNYRKTVLKALQEVADALNEITKSSREFSEQERRVQAGREYLRITNMRFRNGVASYLEVLDAQRQLYASEIDRVRTRLNRQLGVIRLYRALGGGWSDEAMVASTIAPVAAFSAYIPTAAKSPAIP